MVLRFTRNAAVLLQKPALRDDAAPHPGQSLESVLMGSIFEEIHEVQIVHFPVIFS
jgi:hypothetical protein